MTDPRTGGCGTLCDGPGICVKRCGGKQGLKCPEGTVCKFSSSSCVDCLGNCLPVVDISTKA